MRTQSNVICSAAADLQEELRELRRQMNVARSLKDGSKPEYEEKLNRLKELREHRNAYTSKMKLIQETLRGLECKSEAELDARVKELEDKISHGSLLLREEKQVVGQISKLQSQRNQVGCCGVRTLVHCSSMCRARLRVHLGRVQ